MTDDNELDPVARLSDADPAADLEPRAGFPDEVLARAFATPAAPVVPAASAEPAAPATVTDLNTERARRRPRWIQIAAVAASVVLVGGAGFGLGALTGGPAANTASGAGGPISLHGDLGTTGQMLESAAAGGFVGASGTKVSAGLSDLRYSTGFGRNSFSSSGLSTTASNAAVYTFDARGASNAATVAALASALGVEGTPEQKNGAWVVGSQDGTSPSISVGLDGTLSFSYNDQSQNPWDCGGDPSSMEACAAPTDLPSENAAIDALRALITATGRDASAFEFTSESWEGSFTRLAQAWPLVDGNRIDQGWSLELTSSGIYSAYGSLADIVPLGDYAIVSEQDAFARLSDPRFGAQMTAMPLLMTATPMAAMPMTTREFASAEPQQWVPPTEPPATPAAGTTLAWSVNQVEIVGATLGLASQWQPDGSVLVIPTYAFTDAGGSTWSVIAVADSHLDFATE